MSQTKRTDRSESLFSNSKFKMGGAGAYVNAQFPYQGAITTGSMHHFHPIVLLPQTFFHFVIILFNIHHFQRRR